MCYLIAKKFDQKGCLAVESNYGSSLASLVDYLAMETLEKNVQILTVSNKEVYSEYEPYNMIATESEFISKVLQM